MFERLIRFSVGHKLVTAMLTLVLLVWGLWSLSVLPFDATPDITNNQVQVIAQAPSLGAEEVEQFITTPVEMALANIPRVEERRSISRAGLAVVTLVFDDAADIYWARQQVDQALDDARAEIPDGKVELEMAPISTGLGEIYHYTIHAQKGYEHRYSLTDLRTMQDWIVRKQLSGTPGVAEVSGWGGFVQQYEVAVDADRLNNLGITIPELFQALERNNENTGGSYIERNSNQYFIRALGLVGSLDDIGAIAVKTVDGVPVLVRDVATVRMGHATRYGAVTRNGQGEVVAGIALMLKGENFQQVIRNVKERLAQIQKSLPEGVVIEPFIDRTQLVNRVTDTIARNLLEGGAIVVLILILFLGNLRAGLVVASVIPLSMLFAFGMMNVTGVSGNLMSLGAIDFGLIVDGAVIVVEAVCLHLAQQQGQRTDMNQLVLDSALKIRKSAAFGEIIIMIVYIPLLTLVGIEGKMFRPMALTIFFAILGAFILSLTYVPMMCALVLRTPRQHKRRTPSEWLMAALQRAYRPVLGASLWGRHALIVAMLALLGVSMWQFTRMGGEFIPSLEEGDFAAEASLAQGTSLSQMIETTTLAERILKDRFPEVKQVVSRIGSSEIPTDPMPVERADLLISLQPKAKWTSAHTTTELQEMMEEALADIPGLDAELTQPIQMRNNELITGIRQDVAVKIYGPDLQVLNRQAHRVARMIEDVPGVTEPYVERVAGLPQLQVRYNRTQLARYGIDIATANEVLETAFAGRKTGVMLQQDKRFDVVVRLANELRQDPSSLANLYLPLPDGAGSIPLTEVAEITYADAPAQVSHENGERCIYVGFNVRGRDMQSTVADIQRIVDTRLHLPAGYHYAYDGEFQNLQQARDRLMLALPISLLLILVLLYGTLGSVAETLFVFTAIPFSAIGGIWALWLRDMPFSISAGVGFIALFGVSVLNGIVLIGQFNALQRQGITNVRQRIIQGCTLRLRPVIMTALVASLGFLPMALSHGDGAEVQRPLATVVIGGLVTATLLTLVVLPCIYMVFTRAPKHEPDNESL